MKRKTTILLITIPLLLILPAFFVFSAVTPIVNGAPRSDNVVAVFTSDTLPSNYADIIAAAGGQVITAIPEIGVVNVQASTVDSATLVQNLQLNPAIKEAGHDLMADLIMPAQVLPDDSSTTPDTVIPPPPSMIAGQPAADRYYKPAPDNTPPNQWAIYRVGGFGGGIYGFTGGAWDKTTGSSSVTVAILDTGISPLHPDVNGAKIVDAQSSIFGTTANLPFDDGTPVDQQGHGTWTSSLAAGRLNTGGGVGAVVGVAPGVSLANLKVLVRTAGGGGSGQFAWTMAAIVYAANHGYQVISMSLGGFVDPTNHEEHAIFVGLLRATNFAFNHGSLLVAAAGNNGINLNNAKFSNGRPAIELPGSLPNVIAVTATTNPACVENFSSNVCAAGPDGLAFYSNFGSSLHGIAAPGGSVPANTATSGPLGSTGFVRGACSPGKQLTATTTIGQCFTLGHVYYVRAIGTSASTPLVSGAAALVFSVNPTLRPDQVRAILYQTAQNIGPREFFGAGLVDATAAVFATPSP